MKTLIDAMYANAESDFDGGSYNGPSLMQTLEALTFDDVRNTNTFEGYTVWWVAHHVLYYKYFIAAILASPGAVADKAVPGWTADAGDLVPEATKEADWARLKADLRKYHTIAMDAIRNFPASRYEEIHASWEITKARAIAWYLGHDAYHNAQIRSMGISALREKNGKV